MKKTFLSLMILTGAGIFTTQAQIKINSTNIFDIGDQFEIAYDKSPNGISIGASGVTSWDFSSLGQDDVTTLSIISPQGIPGANDFPNSNVVMSSGDSIWSYLTKNSSELRSDGDHQIDNGQGISAVYSEKIVIFPFTYKTNFTEITSHEIEKIMEGFDPDGSGPHGRVDSIKVTSHSNTSNNMDAWGDITTPLGTFPSIRQTVIENRIDTTWQLVNGNWEILSDTSAAYFNRNIIKNRTYRQAIWWTNDISVNIFLVAMEYDASGSIDYANWLKSSATVGINEINNSIEASAYPNPAKNEITIDAISNIKSSIDILDVTGKLIQRIPFETNTLKLSVADYNNGMYFYNIKDVAGDVIYSNKFIVTK